MDNKYEGDLVVLTACKDIEFSIRGVLQRPESLGIAKINFKIFVHKGRDPGCRKHGVDFLRTFVNKYKHALIVLDREGCSREDETREKLEQDLEERLSKSGWNDRAAAVVIDPELENWLWSDSPKVDEALGWQGKKPSLRSWLKEQGFLKDNAPKPSPPKKAVEEALRKVFKPRSSTIYYDIAHNVSLNRCKDRAFLKLKEKLLLWFKRDSSSCYFLNVDL